MPHEHGGTDRHGTHGAGGNERRTLFAMLLTGGFMLAEVAGGLLSGSLALLADAGHMLADTGALALAWFAFRLARRGSDRRRSYGYHRSQVLAAFANGLALLAIVLWIVLEAVQRIGTPQPVLAVPMLVIAALGLLVNLAALYVLVGADRNSLNIRGALLHVAGDALGSVAAIAAALVILATGWYPIDPILSLLVALLILRGAVDLLRRSGHILLEGTPEGLESHAIKEAVERAVPDVEDVHHLHAWSLTNDRPVVTLHARVPEGADHAMTLRSIKQVLQHRFGIGHVTVQLETGACIDETESATPERRTAG